MIKTGSDFSGVGAFNQALDRLGIKHDELFACDMDKYARQTFIYNFGEPKYYPENVYNREIPTESLDIYMTSPPCQSFSLAGKRKGEDSTNGVLFYNSHEFIKKNNPRFFIFENVKGLLSDDNGKTFQRWIDYLGGKSVNGNPVIFPHDEATPYHVYHQVMNAKHYGVPQNRERIFIIGIRDDADNDFSFPKPFHLVKRLKDVLESEVDEKYFLSEKMMEGLIKSGDKSYINQDTQASKVFSENGEAPNICAGTHGYANGYVELQDHFLDPDGIGKSLRCSTGRSLTKKHSYDMIKVGRIIGINPENPKSRVAGLPTEQVFEANDDFEICNTLTTVQKDNVVVLTDVRQINKSKESGGVQPFQQNRVFEGDIVNTLDTECGRPNYVTPQRIRRLTPEECFRLMDFNENFKWNVSDSQAYKQAGNSIVVSCLVEIISKLKL